jgi:hypothetical protein
MITPEGPRDIPFSGSAWPMNMDAYGTVVLEWK